ncbi:MAG: hypothetical protein GY854_31045 [Deltaproteobacteria bacterium]|nr:hypothetical protein [Deltaproteobacteria bacterium]
MSAQKNQSKPDEILEGARGALREYVAQPIFKDLNGPIVEVQNSAAHSISLTYYASNADYLTDDPSGDTEDSSKEPAGMALWLFGPERVTDPAAIYRLLYDNLAKDGILVIASEAPWPGKILCPGEYGEYTSEETASALTRAGFKDITSLIESPFFRMWKTNVEPGSAHQVLFEAEKCLGSGNWNAAEEQLMKLKEPLESVEAVREFALLVAACHDLAGRPEQCLDALTETLRIDPNCARAMCGLGRLSALGGDLGSASDFFSSALKLQPALVAALHGQAVIKEAEGNLEEAFPSMMAASDLRPKDDDLMTETVRLGNAAGKQETVSRFVEHRIGGHPVSPAVANMIHSSRRGAVELGVALQ